jgi:hypothetical protein
MLSDTNTYLKVESISTDALNQSFAHAFLGGVDEINAQRRYIGCVGTLVNTLLPGANGGDHAFVIEFLNGEQVIVYRYDVRLADEALTPIASLPLATPTPSHTPLSSHEVQLLDMVIIALASRRPLEHDDPKALVDQAVEIVLARTRAAAMAYERNA